ncbi:phage tail assembly protein [Chelatococcus asaccharovorans]|uniref:phage tail assembly protein n=1 Tax=Chelatococcus asaccharovorans TaxID=28210 RepID=UPI00224C71C0|nr:hypothetical protein [Chelatococcus asaccharovorans]CAH1649641.1 Phage tail assembly protein [Chelatococcus asaccharovorans]CAH1686938.1 Phage tail assembly protein [Chelatococcus asaccharovorans]
MTATPTFVGGQPRSQTVALEYPLELDGVRYDAVTVRRLTVAEVSAYAEALTAARDADQPAPRFPMFDVPDAVLDHLDDDDAEAVNKVALDFLPRRFRDAVA